MRVGVVSYFCRGIVEEVLVFEGIARVSGVLLLFVVGVGSEDIMCELRWDSLFGFGW